MFYINQNIQSSCLSTLQAIQKIKQENEQVKIDIRNWKLSLAIQAGKSRGSHLIRNLAGFDFSFLTNLATNIIKNENINIDDRIKLAYKLESLSKFKSQVNPRADYYANTNKAIKKQREELEESLISQYCDKLSKSQSDEFEWRVIPFSEPDLNPYRNPSYNKIILYKFENETKCQGIYRDPLTDETIKFELTYPQFESELKVHRDRLTQALIIAKDEETRLGVCVGDISPDMIQPGQLIIQKEYEHSIAYQIKRVDQSGKLWPVDQDGKIKQVGNFYIIGSTNLNKFISKIQIKELKRKYPNLVNLVKDPERELPLNILGIRQENGKYFLIQHSSSLKSPLSVEMKSLSDEGLTEAKARLNQLLSIGLTTVVSPVFLETYDLSTKIEIPPMPENRRASDLKFLLEMFDKINFSKPNKPYYRNPRFLKDDGLPTTPEELREGLVIFIQKINEKLPHQGVPGSGDSKRDREKAEIYKQERIKFYDPIERLMRHNVLYLKEQLEQASKEKKEKVLDEIQGRILNLAEGGLHCGGRWTLEAFELYKHLTGKEGTEAVDAKSVIHQWIDQHKDRVIANMAEEGIDHPRYPRDPRDRYDKSHAYLFILRSLTNLGYEIPLAKVAVFDDVYEVMGRRGAYTTEEEAQEGFKQKCGVIPLLNLIEEECNNKLRDLENGKSDGLAWARIENGLRDLAKASTETSLRAELGELQSKYEKKKAELVKKQKAEQLLSDEEQKLLDRLEEDRLCNEEMEKLQSSQDKGEPLSLKNEARLKALEKREPLISKDEIKFLKIAAANKPTRVKPYEEALRTKNILINTFQEQINDLSMTHQAIIDAKLDEWLEEKGFFDISEGDNGQESKRLTSAGISALLRYLGVFSENSNLKALREQKELYWGKISIEQIDKVLRTAQAGNWILTESPEVEGQLIISQKKYSGEIEHINVHPDWSLDTITKKFSRNKLLPLTSSKVNLELL